MFLSNHNNIKNMKDQDSMSFLEISNSTAMFPEKRILDKAQDSDFKNNYKDVQGSQRGYEQKPEGEP